MPKAIFEFNLPEESERFDVYRSAPGYHESIEELFNQIRSFTKYDKADFVDIDCLSDEHKIGYQLALNNLRDWFYDLLKENGCFIE